MFKLSDVTVPNEGLLTKGYSAEELVGHIIHITSVEEQTGDKGKYIICGIEGEGLDPERDFVTGAKNIVARVLAAAAQGKLPLECTIIKLGGRAFDII